MALTAPPVLAVVPCYNGQEVIPISLPLLLGEIGVAFYVLGAYLRHVAIAGWSSPTNSSTEF